MQQATVQDGAVPILLDMSRIEPEALARLACAVKVMSGVGSRSRREEKCLIYAVVQMARRAPVKIELYWRPGSEEPGGYVWHIEARDVAVSFDYGHAASLEEACEALCLALDLVKESMLPVADRAIH